MGDHLRLHSDSADDVATSSNFRDVHVHHYNFSMKVSFEKKEIESNVELHCKVLKDLKQMKLDIHETLRVENIHHTQLDVNCEFSTEPFTNYGQTLVISLPQQYTKNDEITLVIRCVATGEPGVVWLDPVQTAGKKMPYMYTQGQAVMNRSFFPCQDTPVVKCTYTADVQVPESFTVLMSANINNLSDQPAVYDPEWTAHFEQTTPVPVYLVAMVVGDIKGAKIGPRSTVWAEPSVLDKAVSEFDGVVEQFLVTGERLFGPYVWGRYDILIMPPSFPFGGMENPCLTFVTPCLLVGDKSLTDVVIHEISHSWFGNLVSIANWSEFWLNEGFTMFAQRRIMQEIYGSAYTCLETSVGLSLLEEQTCEIGEDHPLSCLRVIIEPGIDPDDTYNETPYEKGFCFVSYLQHLVGDVKKFDDFLKDYVNKYKYKSVMAEDTLEYFLDYFPHLRDAGVHKKPGHEFDQWLNKPGRPFYQPDLSAKQELTQPADALCEKFNRKCDEITATIDTWKTFQVLYLLDRLLAVSPLPEGNVGVFMESFPNLVNSDNSEIRLRWSKILIRNNHVSHFHQITSFLKSQGKIKYTIPIYRELMKGSNEAKTLAKTTYGNTKAQLHCEVTRRIDAILVDS